MKGEIGTTLGIYGEIIPGSRRLSRIVDLSKKGKHRLKWIDHYHRHGNARLTCRYFGISPTIFYRWYKRWEVEGNLGLEEKSRRPRRFRSSKIPYETISLVVSLRREYPAWSKYKLAVILKRDHGISLSASTVGRILKKKGMIDERKVNKKRKAARRRLRRQKAEKYLKELSPGSLLYIDTKHLTFPGKTFYQFTAIDSKTRIKFLRIFSSASSTNGKRFLEDMRQFMPFPVNNIQTDNGSEFLQHFHQELQRLKITHYFSDPACPKQNSRVERGIQTSEYEFWNFKEGYTVEELNQFADEWNCIYNYVRPHQALAYKTPMEYYKYLTNDVSTML